MSNEINICKVFPIKLDEFTLYSSEKHADPSWVKCYAKDLFGYNRTDCVNCNDNQISRNDFISEFEEKTREHNESVEQLKINLRAKYLADFKKGFKTEIDAFQTDMVEKRHHDVVMRLFPKTLIVFLDKIGNQLKLSSTVRILEYQLTDEEYNELKK